jgi:crotonobetainyl-CoA:carnitine CoA-transferase CaiB-like acyl-CoA transferase
MGMREESPRASGVVTAFQAKDGYFVVQAVREHHLAILAKAVGHPEWLEDERFATRPGWNAHLEDVVRPAIEAWAAAKTKLEVCSELCGQGLAAGPCFGSEDIINDPHVASHEMIRPIERPDADDPLLIVGNPIKLSDTPEAPDTRWPTLGQHTREVLGQELGLADDELAALEEGGVIRSGPTP